MAAAGSYHKLPEPDELIECPYDKSHLIRFKKVVYHLMKCRQNHPSACATCPFDARHQVPRLEWQLHVDTCPQRALVEKDVAYHLLPEPSTQRGDVSVPPYDAWVPPEPEECWDDDDDRGASACRESWTAPVRDRQSIISDRLDADSSSLGTGMRDLTIRSHVPKPGASTGDRGESMLSQYGNDVHRETYTPHSKNFNEPPGLRRVTPSSGVCMPHELASRPLSQLSPVNEPDLTEVVKNHLANLHLSSNLSPSNVPRPIQPQSAWSKPFMAAGTSGISPAVQQPTAQPGTKLTPGLRYPSPSLQGVAPGIPFGLSPAVGRGRSFVRLPVPDTTGPPVPGRPGFSPQENETRGNDLGRSRIAANFNRAPAVNRTVVGSSGTAIAADSSSSSTLTVESFSDAERADGDQPILQQKLKRIDKKLRQISELEKKEHLDEDQKRKLNEKPELEIERDRIIQELKKLKNS